MSANTATPLYSTYARTDLPFVRGEGVWLETADGHRYLDFMAGVAVSVVGHAHPHLVAALTEQAAKLWHVSNIYEIPGQTRLAARLAAVTFADRAFFTNSGAEAIECAIKTARRFHYVNGTPERVEFVTFEGAFHGRTLAAIAAGGQPKYLEGFGPPAPGFRQIAAGDTDALKAVIGPETAGILIEPVQGEGGVRVIAPDFMREVRRLCDEHGILLVLDEIQSGMGRTGKLFAHEWSGIVPDIMAVAKGIGGGFPLGVCLATEAAASGMTVGTHGSTYGGNPLAMAVGNAVLDVVLADGFLDGAAGRGLLLKQRLAAVADTFPGIIEEVRGLGLLLGVRCRGPNQDLVRAANAEGLLTVAAGDNVVRFVPPLIVGEAEIDAAMQKLEAACAKLAARHAAA